MMRRPCRCRERMREALRRCIKSCPVPRLAVLRSGDSSLLFSYPFRPGTCASQLGCEVACSTLM